MRKPGSPFTVAGVNGGAKEPGDGARINRQLDDGLKAGAAILGMDCVNADHAGRIDGQGAPVAAHGYGKG
jgi:hypothetical protein